MRQLVVLSLVCVSLAFSRTLPRIERSLPPEIPVEQLVLNQISLIVLLHNSSTGIPLDADKKIPLSKLTSCVKSEQREAIKSCAKEILHNFPVADDHQKSTASGNADSDFRPHMIPPPELTKIVECIWDLTAVIEKEGNRVNATNLKLSVIDHSSLTEAQKISAAENLNTCLEADLSSSPALSIGSKAANMALTDRMKTAFKATLCSFKSVIENGCAERDESSQKLIIQRSAESLESDSSDSTEMLHDVSEPGEAMSQMKRKHKKCASGTAHHQCASEGSTATNTATPATAAKPVASSGAAASPSTAARTA